MRARTGEFVLRCIGASAPIESQYRRRLQGLVEAMAKSMLLHLHACWEQNEPDVGFAHDTKSSAVLGLEQALTKWGRRWQKRFNRGAREIAFSFATMTRRDYDRRFGNMLSQMGLTVQFAPSAAMTEAFRSVVAENVNLIKSIPARFLTDVQSSVWVTVMRGGDAAALSRAIRKTYGIAWQRAALIARDQTHKAKAIMEEARRADVGIEEAVWVHSGAGREPRPEHVRWGAQRRRYNIRKGMWSAKLKKYVWPGTEINCRCGSRSVFPELGPRQGAVPRAGRARSRGPLQAKRRSR